MLCSTSKESLQKIQWEDLKEDVECTGSACAAEALLRHSTIQKRKASGSAEGFIDVAD
jgi:hypothetical protein